jgi:DNA-binding LacI/PurR family transcriptional regulator
MSSPHLTLRDVARAAGVSVGTASMALRNDPRISEARGAKVRSAAQRLGYRPNPAAAALAHFKRASRVAPIQAALAWLNFWPDPRGLHQLREFDRYWLGAHAAAEKFGYRLEEIVGEPRLSAARLADILLARGIAGILLPPHQSPFRLADFPWDSFCIVRFGRSVETPAVHLVTADQVANTILAFREIRERGYERIGFIGSHSAHLLFDAGFLRVQQHIPPRQQIPPMMVNPTAPRASQAEIARWLKRHKPDAVFTDILETPDILRKCGYGIPGDIGVAVTSVLDATVDAGIYQNPEEIGRVGILLLLSLIHDNDRGIPAAHRETLIKGQWVDGASLPRR